MLTFSNALSIMRAPLALLFLFENIFVRLAAILLAMFTDVMDGYFARRNRSTSQFGAFLDPAMDKFFVYFVLSILYVETHIVLWQIFAIVSRDIALVIFGIYLLLSKKYKKYKLQGIRFGKMTTALQFILIIGLSLGYIFSWYVYTIFIILGVLSFIELTQTIPKKNSLLS